MVWAVPCDCTTGDRTERALQRARVPERYRHCDFENYETDNDHRKRHARSARQLEPQPRARPKCSCSVSPRNILRCPACRANTGILLMGPCGVGKTHLAVSAMKTIVLRGHSGLFYDYRELLKAIQDSYNPENQATEMSVLEPVLKTEILVLDDVGSSKPSRSGRSKPSATSSIRVTTRSVSLCSPPIFSIPTRPAPIRPCNRRGWPACAAPRSRTHSPNASANAFAPASTKCAALSKSTGPITARKSATPAASAPDFSRQFLM